MKPNKRGQDGSLELLLDTITNTFGSVLFIAILTALLVRLTPDSLQQETSDSPFDLASHMKLADDLQARIAVLQNALLDRPLPSQKAIELNDSLAITVKVLTEAMEEKKTLASQTLKMQERIERVATETAEAEKTLAAALTAAEDAAERRMQAETRAASLAESDLQIERPESPVKIIQNATLPVLGSVDKRQFALLLKYGRVYVMHAWSNTGQRLGPNPEHFAITTDSDNTQLARARPDAGFEVNPATLESHLATTLARFPPSEWVVAVVTAHDSFSDFQAVKMTLVALGYQYDPIELTDDGVLDYGGKAKGQ